VAAELQMEIRLRLERELIEQEPVRHQPDLLDDSEYSVLWEQLSFDPKPLDDIIEQSGISAREVSSMLLMLELKGMVKNLGNGRYIRA
jgi:DNA processing protein